MKAIGYKNTGPIDGSGALTAYEAAEPVLGGRDLLVEVKGISINPVDVKVRANMVPKQDMGILGYDSAGIVRAVGRDVRHYRIGDAVFYAGDLTRPGTNAELHAVDERIVGIKPESLAFAEAAALPLTAITAWEILFDSFALSEGAGQGQSLLVIGGAGGVGSILIQLAKALTGLTVITTASRPETVDWVREMGADHVINHREPIAAQVAALGLQPAFVASLTGTDGHFNEIVELIRPRGHIAIIDDPKGIDISAIKLKALSFSWEFMFARSMFQTGDMIKQQELLNRVSALVDEGRLRTTARSHLGRMSVETLREGHKQQESGRVIGKNVLDGF